MANSGIDEFYEIIRLILAKYFSEQEGLNELPGKERCDELLAAHGEEVAFILDGVLRLQTPSHVFEEVRAVMGQASIHGQGFTALDQAFEELTSRSYKSDKGQYFTPRHVIDMCVEALDPKPGELICDPACGSAAFLKSVHTYGVDQHGAAATLYGFDYSHRACQVAQVVSLIGTQGAIKVEQVDSLKLPNQDEQGVALSVDVSLRHLLGEPGRRLTRRRRLLHLDVGIVAERALQLDAITSVFVLKVGIALTLAKRAAERDSLLEANALLKRDAGQEQIR